VKEEFPKENIDILFGFVAMMFVKNAHWLEWEYVVRRPDCVQNFLWNDLSWHS
jgi:hypothetical protein